MPPQNDENLPMDFDAIDAPPAVPVFVPQGPPPGLGVLRTLILALMVAVAVLDLLLFAGVYLALATPQAQLPAALSGQIASAPQEPGPLA